MLCLAVVFGAYVANNGCIKFSGHPMPYLLVAQVVLIWLVVQYVRSANASRRFKLIVCGVAAGSFLGLWLWPTMLILFALLQLAISILLAIHRLFAAPDQKPPLAGRG
jgi:hypothetical protein